MMKNKIVLKIILVLFVTMSCSDDKNKIKKSTNPVTIKMVTHGQAADPFWSVVKNGAKDAAESLGINFNYQSPQTFDMITMSQIIDAVVSTNPDGLIVSVPDLNALKKSVRSASEKGIPIIVINSGIDIMKEVEILTYVGQSEYEAGIKAGEELLKYNITTALCVNHEIGNISLDQREQGFRKILNENNINVKTIPIDASDPSETRESLRTYLSSNKNINGILTLGPLGAIPIMNLLKEIDVDKNINLATFDFTPEIINGILGGRISFALDQQQYLQGYLPVVLMNLYITNKNMPAYKKLETGPSIIDMRNAQDVLSLSKKGKR